MFSKEWLSKTSPPYSEIKPYQINLLKPLLDIINFFTSNFIKLNFKLNNQQLYQIKFISKNFIDYFLKLIKFL